MSFDPDKISTEGTTILIVDDDDTLLQTVEKLLSNEFNVITTTDINNALKLIDNNSLIGVVVSDYDMPEMDGIAFLIEVGKINPNLRRIMISGKLNLEIAIKSVNKAQIHAIIQKPWKIEEVKNIIKEQLRIFLRDQHFTQKYTEMKDQLENNPSSLYHHQDDIIDLLLHLNEADHVSDFSNKFTTALEGMQSLALLNLEFYFSSNDPITLVHTMQYLSDIEVIANQYGQKILLMYIFIIRAYVYLYNEEISTSIDNFKAVRSLFPWLADENINREMGDLIEDFEDCLPFENLEEYSHNERYSFDLVITSKIKENIRKLLNIRIDDLVRISDEMFRLMSHKIEEIFHFIIIKNENPIYEKKSPQQQLNMTLVGGFVSAISAFLHELIAENIYLEKVQYNAGVLLLHKVEDLTFVLIAFSDDIRHRVALRQTAEELKEPLRKIKISYTPDKNTEKVINKVLEKNFGKFWE